MKTWLLILLMLFSGGYFFTDVCLVAAQQQVKEETAPVQSQVPLRFAQAEQPKPERPIRQLLPGAGSLVKPLVAPPPPPEPWYKNSTVLVAIISAVSAIAVALIGLLKRKG
jgi:hypothetical protein